MNKKERLLIFILACINFTHILDFMILMPLNPQLTALFNINQQQFSLLVSAYTFSAFFSGLVAAFFVDNFDRKKVLLFGYIGFIIGTFGCAFSPSYHVLLLARIFAGLFGGLIGAQVLSIIGDNFPYQRRASAMSYLTAAFSVASVVGVPLGLYIASKTNWHAPFVLVGGLGIIIAILIVVYIPPMVNHLNVAKKHSPYDAYRHVFKSKNQRRALLLSITMMLGHFSIIPFISKYMVSNVGLAQEHISLIYLCGGLATIFTAPLVGMLADKKGKFLVFAVFCSLCLIPIFLITNLPPVPMYVALIVTTIFFICVSSRMIPMQAMITSVVPASQRGGFMSINSSLIQLGSGMASLLAGFVVYEAPDNTLQNYNYVGYAGMAICIVCIFIAQKLKPAKENIQLPVENDVVEIPTEIIALDSIK